ncbi:MAG: phosphodiester glycosidase family protein [Cyanobacteria bacterium P01_F01_bin.53]
MAIPLKQSLKQSVVTRRPIRAFTRRVFACRVLSLGIMTGLGWSIVNSAPMPSAFQSLDLGEEAATSLASGVTPDLSHLRPLQPFHPVAKANDSTPLAGNRIRINGRSLPGFWQQKNGRLGISSASMANVMGAELLSTTDPTQQPIRWFPTSQDAIHTLPAWWDATDRYIDVSDLAVKAGWSGQASGTTLELTLPQSRVSGIRQGKQTWGDRVVVDLSGPATWQMEAGDGYTITVGGSITPEMIRGFRAVAGNLITQLNVAPLNGGTVLKIKTKDGASPQIWSSGDPAKVVIDIRQDAMIERDVAWAPGLRWRQQYINVGAHRFPVYMFITRPNPSTLAFRTIHANANSAIGIEPILSTAQRQRATGAVNAGFFNRNNQLPLGAVRSDGQWISGPILGRGAMAWNEQGDLIMDRFSLSEMVSVSDRSYRVLTVNSGYVQAGVARYTAGWGQTYTPIVDNEIVVTVRNGTVSDRQTLGKAGSGNVSIPEDGYLLTLRNNREAGNSFLPGLRVELTSESQPAVFEHYPNVVGGGPLLIRDRNIVLNPQLEGFSTNFIEGSAPRTAVGKMADGTWIIATMHDRVGGRGPNLSETAKIMQQLGAVDALNLDGGSSSSLYLGGQLLNRQPRTAARVNNGIGLFVLGQD